MPRNVGLAKFPPPSARWPSPALKAAENASPGRSRGGRRRTDAPCRLPLDSRPSNDLFGRVSVDGVYPDLSIPRFTLLNFRTVYVPPGAAGGGPVDKSLDYTRVIGGMGIGSQRPAGGTESPAPRGLGPRLQAQFVVA
jgi:hypothetical protein